MTSKEIKDVIAGLLLKVDELGKERPSAGTKYRLMGLAADVTEVADMLQQEVLQRVSQDAVLDVDADIDYMELSVQVMAAEASSDSSEEGRERELVNEALGTLNDVLLQIDSQLSRHHKDEEYVRLYEAEMRRYKYSGSSTRSKRDFEEWKDYECNGHPSQENIEDYRVEKLLHMFEKGVLNGRVEHMQRATRYPGEVDFSQIEGNPKIIKTVYYHYAALRKIVDFKDGCLVVDPVRVGRYFYASRHEENAKMHRTNFLKYMHKIGLAQEELRHVEAEQKMEEEKKNVPNKLTTSDAEELMEDLVDAGILNNDWQPNGLSGTERALVAKTICDRLDIKEVWQVFGHLWNEKPETLRSYLNKALEQKKSLEYQDKLKKILC